MAGTQLKPGIASWLHATNCLKLGFAPHYLCSLCPSQFLRLLECSKLHLSCYHLSLILWIWLFSFWCSELFRAWPELFLNLFWSCPLQGLILPPSAGHLAAGLLSCWACLSTGRRGCLNSPCQFHHDVFNPVSWPFGWTTAMFMFWGREAAPSLPMAEIQCPSNKCEPCHLVIWSFQGLWWSLLAQVPG